MSNFHSERHGIVLQAKITAALPAKYGMNGCFSAAVTSSIKEAIFSIGFITPAIKYPHYNYAIYGNDYLDHWQWFPLTYVYANEYNNFISKLARQLISREKINKLLKSPN